MRKNWISEGEVDLRNPSRMEGQEWAMDVAEGKRSRGMLSGTSHQSNSFCVRGWDAVPITCPKRPKGWRFETG